MYITALVEMYKPRSVSLIQLSDRIICNAAAATGLLPYAAMYPPL